MEAKVEDEQLVEINAPIEVFLGLGDSNESLVRGQVFDAEAIAYGSPLSKLTCG